MAQWTKKAAINRANNNSLLQEAMRIEPRLIPVIEETKRQRRTKSYHRIRKYVELRNRGAHFVGHLAENEKLGTIEYYDAVREAIDDLLPPDDVDLYPEGRPVNIKSITKTSKVSSERDKMTPSLRFSILERDNFKCRACGRSSLHNNDDVILHVDHIIPITEGGKTEPGNLQTLCQGCNLGKGTKVVKQMKLPG